MKSWLWLLLGIGMGIGLGLGVGWGLLPIRTAEVLPEQLRSDYQDEYVFLTAMAYNVDGDLESAQARLTALDPVSPTASLVGLTERYIAGRISTPTVKVLVDLARDLDVLTPAMQPYLVRRVP